MTSGRPEGAELLGAAALGDALARLIEAVRPMAVVNGWATVELDRAEVELSAASMGEEGGAEFVALAVGDSPA